MKIFLCVLTLILMLTVGTKRADVYAADKCTEFRYITRVNEIFSGLDKARRVPDEQIGKRIDNFLEHDIASIKHGEYIELIEELKVTGFYNPARASKLFWALAQSRSREIPSEANMASLIDNLGRFVAQAGKTNNESEVVDSLNWVLSYQVKIQERYMADGIGIRESDIDKVILELPVLIDRLSQQSTRYDSEAMQRFISVTGLLNLTRCAYVLLKWNRLEDAASSSNRLSELVTRFDFENGNTFDALHRSLTSGQFHPRAVIEHYTNLVALFINKIFFKGFLVDLDWEESINSFIAIGVLTHAKYPQLHLEMLLGFGLENIVDQCDNVLGLPNAPTQYAKKARRIKQFVQNALEDINEKVSVQEWESTHEKLVSFLSINPSARDFFDHQLPAMEKHPELTDDARRYRRYLLMAAQLF